MKKFITSASLLSICLLTSCSIFKGSHGEPDTQGKQISKKAELPIQKIENSLRPVEGISANNTVNSNPSEGRTIAGFIEPDVTQLPDNKDLQESNNVAPVPSPLTPKLEAPVAPLLIDPSAPLPPNP